MPNPSTRYVVDRSEWASGPWDNEPDEAEWRDPDTGLLCRAIRSSPTGHWCGYVGVPERHLRYRDDDDEAQLDVHGGVTLTGPLEDGDELWWFGFDCAHAYDAWPYYYISISKEHETYRTLAYIESQCRQLAAQLGPSPVTTETTTEVVQFLVQLHDEL